MYINIFIIGNYRFTEIYVEGLQHSEDLQLLIQHYLERFTIDLSVINGIIRSLFIAVWYTCRYIFIIFCLLYRFYREINDLAQNKLQDGTGRRPQYRYHGRSNIIIVCTSCTTPVSVICVELCNLHKIMVIMMC